MSKIDKLKQDAIESLRDDYIGCDDNYTNLTGEDNRDNYLTESIFEVADSMIPIYTSDILECAAEDISLATSEPELGRPGDGDAIKIIQLNIYDVLNEALWEWWHENESEIVKTAEVMESTEFLVVFEAIHDCEL